MSRIIEAIYEGGIFRPVDPVDLPEGTRVRIEAKEYESESDEALIDALIAQGAAPSEATGILNNLRLLWGSYDTLSDEQRDMLDRARLDQQRFFNRRSRK